MSVKEELLLQRYKNFKNNLQKAFPFKIAVKCDEKSIYYFNQNLLTPAEYLNALNLKMKNFTATRSGSENIQPIYINDFQFRFIDIEEFNENSDQYFAQRLFEVMQRDKPSHQIFQELEKIQFKDINDIVQYLKANISKLNWYENSHKIILEYLNKNLSKFRMSQMCQPIAIFNILYFDENFQQNVQKFSEEFFQQHESIFQINTQREKVDTLVINLILFDVMNQDKSVDDYKIQQWLQPLTKKLNNSCYFRLPINNPMKHKKHEGLAVDFNIQGNIYKKYNIRSYQISKYEKRDVNVVKDEERCQNFNLYDCVVFKDNLEKILSFQLTGSFQNKIGIITHEINELKKKRKKSFWQVFNTKSVPQEVEDEQEFRQNQLQFLLAEIYFMTGNYEDSALEFKQIVSQCAVIQKEKKKFIRKFLQYIFRILCVFNYVLKKPT